MTNSPSVISGREHPMPPSPAVPPHDVLGWEEIPGHAALRRWTEDLRGALNKGTTSAWVMAGRFAMVVTPSAGWAMQAARRVAADLELPFHLVDVDAHTEADDVRVRGLGIEGPAFAFLEPGRWMQTDELAERIGVMAEFGSDCVFVCTAPSIPDSPVAIRRRWALDRFLELPDEPAELAARRLVDRIGPDRLGPSITEHLGRFAREFLATFGEQRRMELAVLHLHRLHARLGRRLEFADVVELSARGFLESAETSIEHAEERRAVAYHEAGHAIVAAVDSAWADLPEMVSILPTQHYLGVTVSGSEYHQTQRPSTTYREFVHAVRVSLAGRAAEEIGMGAAHISAACVSDLEFATDYSLRAFDRWGFVPGMDRGGHTGTNLMVRREGDTERLHEVEAAHLVTMVREFLAHEYTEVMRVLEESRIPLDRLAERLQDEVTLDGGAVEAAFIGHGT